MSIGALVRGQWPESLGYPDPFSEFAKLHMGLVVLVKKMSVLINFPLQNTNLVSFLSKICPNFGGHVWQNWKISWILSLNNIIWFPHKEIIHWILTYLYIENFFILGAGTEAAAVCAHLVCKIKVYEIFFHAKSQIQICWLGVVWFMACKATFNNISVISRQSVLLVEETGVHRENHRPVASHWQTLSHNVVSNITLPWTGFELLTLVVIGTDCTGSIWSLQQRPPVMLAYLATCTHTSHFERQFI